MHYSNTVAMLEAQQKQQTIYLENVMELLQAVFADVRYSTGKLVEDCQIENMDRLVATLTTVTNSLLFVYRKREQEILACESRYLTALGKVQATCSSYSDKIKDLDEKLKKLEKLQAEQEALLAKEQTKNAALVALTKQSQSLQEQIDALLALDAGNNAGKLQAAIGQKQQQLSLLQEKYQQDCALSEHLDKELQELEAQSHQCSADLTEKTAALAAAQEKLTEVTQARELAAQETERVEQILQSTTGEYLELVTNCKAHQQRAMQVQQDRLTALQTLQSLKDEIDLHQAGVQAALEQQQEASGQLAALNEQSTALQQTLEEQTQQIGQQRALISQYELNRQSLEQEAEHMQEQMLELETALSFQTAANEQFKLEHLDRVQQELAEKQAQAAADREQLQQFEELVQQQEQDYKTLSSELSLLKIKEHSTHKILNEAQAKLDQQRALVTELEAQVREKATQSTALMDREQELQRRLDEKNLPQIQAQIGENIARLEQTLEQAKQDEETLAQSVSDLEKAQQKHAQILRDLEKAQTQTAACQAEYDALLTQYQQAVSPENQQRMEQMTNRLAILKKLAKQLTLTNACGQAFRMDQSVALGMDRAEQTLQTLSEAIQNYAQCRQAALEG